ncbi:MAG: metallophosphoesterase family protein [Bacteroidota bacterium]
MKSQLLPTIWLFMLISFQLGSQSDPYLTDYYPASPVPDRIMLTLTEDPAHSMAVNWRTSRAVGRGFVQIAVADPGPDLIDSIFQVYPATTEAFLSDRNGANYHSVIMDNLDPATQYSYRVGDSLHWSEWIHFTTAPLEPQPLSFLYFGDAQNNIKSMWSRCIRGAYAKMPEANFLLHAGDLINRPNRDVEWGEWFYAGGWIYSTIPSIATPGNHEYGRNAQGERELSRHWRPTFTFPMNGPEGLEETVYYVDYQDTRVISLNTSTFNRSPADSVKQVTWLREVLKNNPNRWTIVTMHYPIYSTKYGRDNKRLRDGLQPIFEKMGVDLVLQGHDHAYGRGSNLPLGDGKRKTIGGPIYVVSVSGPKMYDQSLEEWMQRSASNTQLYQLITIDGDQLHFKAYTVTGELYDAFELRKQKKGRNLFLDQAPTDVEERLGLPKSFRDRYTEEDWSDFEGRFEAYMARKKAREEK